MAEEEKKKKTKKKAAPKAKKAKAAKPKAVKKAKTSKKSEEAPKAKAPKEVKAEAAASIVKEEAAKAPAQVSAPVKTEAPKIVEAKAEKKVFKSEKKPSKKVQYHGVGGRKTSRARVWLTPGNGQFRVNGKKLIEYVVGRQLLMYQAVQPFMLTNTKDKYNVSANVHGGGISSQIGAVRQAIAKALLEVNPDFRPPLRTTGMLTRDSRIKERKKYGRKKARKSFQFSKR